MIRDDQPPQPPEWLPLARPCYRAAALVFSALDVLGQYPEGAPDYDRTARDLLMQALERLTPGLGNPDVLGLPLPRAPESDQETPKAPEWVAEVLAEAGALESSGSARCAAPAVSATDDRAHLLYWLLHFGTPAAVSHPAKARTLARFDTDTRRPRRSTASILDLLDLSGPDTPAHVRAHAEQELRAAYDAAYESSLPSLPAACLFEPKVAP